MTTKPSLVAPTLLHVLLPLVTEEAYILAMVIMSRQLIIRTSKTLMPLVMGAVYTLKLVTIT